MKNDDLTDRLPPGQQWVAAGKWPIIGERLPRQSDLPWTLTLSGLASGQEQLSLSDLAGFPQTVATIDIHCVTRWSRPDVTFSGILLADLVSAWVPRESAKFVSFVARSERNHSTSLRLSDAIELGTLIATHVDGQPLTVDHGGPVRNVVPARYFYKSVKWLERIEFLDMDRLGYWEAETGYHNHADPWKEERYVAPSIDKRTAALLMEGRNFSGRDLRSIDCRARDLARLDARGALLRDGRFENANLMQADFDGANLSNAHLEGANLAGARFVGADLEGANLSGANLDGADLTGASLIGASFFEMTPAGQMLGAVITRSTIIPEDILMPLTPDQLEFVRVRIPNR